MLCVFKRRTGVFEDNFVADWPQCVSSAPFSQSFSLSQVQLIGMQRPLGQAKKLTGHLSFLLSARENRKKHHVESLTIDKKSQNRFRGETKHPTWAVSLIWIVSTVVVAVTHPWGQITQSSFLTALEGRSFHSQAEETGAIGGFCE